MLWLGNETLGGGIAQRGEGRRGEFTLVWLVAPWNSVHCALLQGAQQAGLPVPT